MNTQEVANEIMDIVRDAFGYEMDWDEDTMTSSHRVPSDRFSNLGDLDDYLYGQIYNLLMGRTKETS